MASSHSPLSLHTPSNRESSVESCSVGTPQSAGFNPPPPKSAEREFCFSARLHGADATDELDSDELLFPCDQPDVDVPLYPSAQPFGHAGSMAGPVDIAPSRSGSRSPRNPESNMTSQFKRPSISVREEPNMDDAPPSEAPYGGRKQSVGMLGTTPYGTRSIPVRGGDLRRESNALSGSLMNGMSWGGISVGSFIRDE